jgi:hypothetical protein
MNLGGAFELSIAQGSHSPGDSIGLGPNVLKVTIKCSSLSSNNAYVGINQPANNINVLQPGESATYHDDRVALTDQDGNGLQLYIGFDPSGTNGFVLVSVIYDEKKPSC